MTVVAGSLPERISPSQSSSPVRWRLSNIPSSLLPPICLSLRSPSATSSGVVSPLSSGPIGGSLNAICVIVRGCVLDSALDVQRFSVTLEAFSSENINLDIMIGKSLFQQS